MIVGRLLAQKLTAEAFAPYGTAVDLPAAGRLDLRSELVDGRRGKADARLTLAVIEPVLLPYRADVMEVHRFSSQAFVPVDVSRYLVIVAGEAPGGGPDAERLQAFIGTGQQAIVYAPNTWHHPMRVLDRTGRFTVLTFVDGSEADETWADLPEAVTVEAA